MSVPNWLDGKSPQVRGRKFEKTLAKKVGGRVQPGSGAIPFFKEDIDSKTHLIQCKMTTKKQYILHESDLNVRTINALKAGKLPALFLKMGKKIWGITLYGENVEFTQ